MTVNEIISRIIELSHHDDAPDTDLTNKALAWLNFAYQELLEDCLPFLKRYLQTTVSLTSTLGTVALPSDVYRLQRVLDVAQQATLTELSPEAMAERSLSNQTGAPRYFSLSGQTLTLYPTPTENRSLKVVYLPGQPAGLVLGGSEASILIPKQFHPTLIWGALVWGSSYERGLNTASEIGLFQAKWDEGRQRLKLALSARPEANLTVSPFHFVGDPIP